MDLLVHESHLDLNAEDLLAERVDAHLVGQLERLAVVFQGVLGLRVDVGVVEGAAQLDGYWFGIGFEVVDYVGFVDEVYVDERTHAESYSGMALGRRRRRRRKKGGVGGKWGEEKYEAKARVIENGYSLKSLVVATRKEAFLRVGNVRGRILFFVDGRLIGNREALWKAD